MSNITMVQQSMLTLIELYYQAQKDIIFSDKIVSDKYILYHSNKIPDIYRNFAVISNIISVKSVLDDLKKDFASINRKPCIYLNAGDSGELKDLIERHWKVTYTDTWLRYEDKELVQTHPVKKVCSASEKKDYLETFKNFYKGNIQNLENQMETIFDETLESGDFCHFIIYDETKPVGIASLRCFNSHCLIFNFCCDPEYYGKGFRSSLMAECVKEMRAIDGKSLNLKINSSSNSERWFIQNGFRKTFSAYGMTE